MLAPPAATYSEELYRFLWHELGVEFLLENFNDRREDIACELTVNYVHPSEGGRLFSGRLLLIGPRSRADVIRALNERTIEEIDWGALLEQACQLARDRFRRGEPIVKLADVMPDGERRWLYDRYILDQAISILYGDGATAKSCLSLRWGIDVALNHGPVLYLDWEDDAATHAERLRALCTPLHLDSSDVEVYYQRRFARLSESVRELRRMIAEKGFVLVVVDSLGMAAGDPNNHEYMIEAVRACRALGTAVLAIHHLPKNSMDKSKPFGSVYASNEARLTWLVEKTQEEDTPQFSVLLTNHKSNRSRTFAKRALRISFEMGMDDALIGIAIEAERMEDIDAFRPKLPLWQHVRAVCVRRALSVKEIVAALSEDGRTVSEAGVRRAINDHKKEFQNLSQTATPIWGVRESERTEVYGGVRGEAISVRQPISGK